MVQSYVKEHKLQDKTDKKNINCDEKLTQLLKLTDEDVQVTYLNLVSFLKKHFL